MKEFFISQNMIIVLKMYVKLLQLSAMSLKIEKNVSIYMQHVPSF